MQIIKTSVSISDLQLKLAFSLWNLATTVHFDTDTYINQQHNLQFQNTVYQVHSLRKSATTVNLSFDTITNENEMKFTQMIASLKNETENVNWYHK